MKLYPYQEKLVQEINEAWNNGAQNVLFQLPTGGGKTAVFCNIINDFKFPSITIAHRNQIVHQISKTLARDNISHNIIAPTQVIKDIIAMHMREFNKSFYNPQGMHNVAGVDTLAGLKKLNPHWFKNIRLQIHDEAHHVLKNNKWGRAAEMFPNARGLFPTATPERADGMGLGRWADGIIDVMVQGPPMRELINAGFLCDYKVYGAPRHINLKDVPISASGDYSPPKLRDAVHKAKITGDIVEHYIKIAKDKLGITFAVDIEAATEIAAAYRAAGIPAEVITSKTPEYARAIIFQRFERRDILQIVNVDLLGEGVDVPAVEVISMARPTKSFPLYAQQIGRVLRYKHGKDFAMIIDHVDNCDVHKMPEKKITWSLDRRERRARGHDPDVIGVKNCLNPECMRVYERIHRVCPYCEFYSQPANRSSPEFVDGDLVELDAATLAELRGEVARIDDAPKVPGNLSVPAQLAIINNHKKRQEAQYELRGNIALLAGYHRELARMDSEIYRRFYFRFGVDIMSAQALNIKDATELNARVIDELNLLGVKEKCTI